MNEELERKSVDVVPDKRATEYLANERTFLAWVRTGIAVISLGFVVVRFGVWLRELPACLDPQMRAHEVGASLPIGIGLMAFGGALTLLAAWRYHVVNRQIEQGEVRADHGLILLVTAAAMPFAVGKSSRSDENNSL